MSTLPKKRTTGRPSKFTPATRARILRCLTAGMPITLAATAAGTCYQSIVTWRAANPEFDSAIGEAVALGVEKRLAVIEKASDADDWRAAAWLLEHCQPEHFSKSRLEVTGANGGPLAGAVGIFLPRKDGTAETVVEVNTTKEVHDAN